MYQFAVGDHVVTTRGGLGVITGIESLHGTACYVIENEFCVVRKPVTTKNESLRDPVSREALIHVLRKLERVPRPLPSMGHKQEAHIRATLSTNNFADAVTLLCQLYVPAEQERSTLRMEYYEMLLTIVASEVAYVLALPRQGMRGLIEASIVNRKRVPELLGSN